MVLFYFTDGAIKRGFKFLEESLALNSHIIARYNHSFGFMLIAIFYPIIVDGCDQVLVLFFVSHLNFYLL